MTLSPVIAERLRQGDSAARIESRYGHDVLTPEPFTRGAQANGLPPALLEQVFAIGTGDVFTVEIDDGVIVGRLTAIELAEQSDDAEQWQAVLAQLKTGMTQDLQGQLAQALRADITVRVNQPTIEALFIAQ